MLLKITLPPDAAPRPCQPLRAGTVAVAAHVRLLEVILALIATLLAIPARRRAALRHLPLPGLDLDFDLPLPYPDTTPTPLRIRSIHDGTHLVCEHPILWVIGPGPCRGMRPRARTLPLPRPRIARAPPSLFESLPTPSLPSLAHNVPIS